MKTNVLENESLLNLENLLKQSEKGLNRDQVLDSISACKKVIENSNIQYPELELVKKMLFKISNEVGARFSIATKKDFVNLYLDELEESEANSPEDVFNECNEYYFKLFGELKFNNFKDFKNAMGMA